MKSMNLLVVCWFFFLVSCDKSTNPEESATWKLQRDKQDDITYYSILFSDKNKGWIIGYNGTIKTTTDGGNVWESQESGVASNLWAVSFINNTQGWISGANNTILKTTDGGKNWINISPSDSIEKIYVEIKFIDESNGWTSNNYGEILSTSDGGVTWIVKKSGLLGGSIISVINKHIVYALSGKLYKTSDGGETWNTMEVSVPKNYRAAEMFFTNSNDGYIGTVNGSGGAIITEYPLIMTKDGGENWFESEYLKDQGFRCVYFINEKIGWIGGTQNIYKTYDGGNHWVQEYSPPNEKLFAKDMFFINENCGWLINWDGEIYKYE
jgi:photosystem II stability/assembly factor-like uncharacterized protein